MMQFYKRESALLPALSPLLRERALAIPPEEILSLENQALIRTLKEIALTEQDRYPELIPFGFSAPLIGILKRVILIPDDLDFTLLINPEITQRSKEQTTHSEHCLSLYPLAAQVRRANKIELSALDENGRPVQLHFEGEMARLVQHEMDHLEGKLISTCEKLHWVEKEDWEHYSSSPKRWKKSCPVDLLEELKRYER